MVERVSIPPPSDFEESRQWAEALADLHYATGTIVENGRFFVPGEALDELKDAWDTAEKPMQDLIKSLTPAQPGVPIPSLKNGHLLGVEGRIKRSTLGRLRDLFFGLWNSEPKAPGLWPKIREAACGYLEFGETVIGSIPGHEYLEEMMSLTKQLISVRSKRPD